MQNEERIYYLYWVFLPSLYIDIYTEGYIGITYKPIHRKASHRANLHGRFSKAIKKHRDNLVWRIIANNLTKQEALDMESHYRPKENIGWNMARGGQSLVGEKNVEERLAKAQRIGAEIMARRMAVLLGDRL